MILNISKKKDFYKKNFLRFGIRLVRERKLYVGVTAEFPI